MSQFLKEGLIGEDLLEIQRASLNEEEDQAHHKQHVAHASGEEGLETGLLGRNLLRIGVALVEPEPDKQVRTETHDLPEDEEHQQVIGHHQPQHPCSEQRNVGEETAIEGIQAIFILRWIQIAGVGHVPCAIDEDHGEHKPDHEQHPRGHRIHSHTHMEGDFPHGHPRHAQLVGMFRQFRIGEEGDSHRP